MKFKIINRETGDDFKVVAHSVDNLRAIAQKGIEKRDWKVEECYSVIIEK